MFYYLNVQFQGQRVKLTAAFRNFAKAPKTRGTGNFVMKHSPYAVFTSEMGLLFLKFKFSWKK